jgi:hypothetical protein
LVARPSVGLVANVSPREEDESVLEARPDDPCFSQAKAAIA